MKLVILTALIAVCGADKLDRTYLPPPSAKTAGGSPEELQAPRNSFNNGLGGLPKGSYQNEFQGVVVDAAEAGVRASEHEESGLGFPRTSYGSTDSKVGAAAFKSQPSRSQAVQRRPERPAFNQQASFVSRNQENFNKQGSFASRNQENFDNQGSFASQNQENFNNQGSFASQNQQYFNNQGTFASQNNEAFSSQSQNPQSNNFNYQNSQTQQFPRDPTRAAQDRKAELLKFENVVGPDRYFYSYETDNDIKAEENGDTTNGVRAQGGFSYKGDDGQTYSVTYIADEGGYQPQGAHLPTPPPIPEAILRSLEKNAKDEADGIVDDGSYDAKKYNAGSEYSENVNANGKYPFSKFRSQAEAASSGTFINQNQQEVPDDQTGFNKQGPSVSRFSQQSSDLTNSATNGQPKNSFNRQKPSYTHNEQLKQSSDIVSTHDDSSSDEFGQSSAGIQNKDNTFSSFAGSAIQYMPPHKLFIGMSQKNLQNIPQSDKFQTSEDLSDSYDDSFKFKEPSSLVPLGEQDLQSESRPEQAITSFGRPVSNTNKFISETGLDSSNTPKQPSHSIRPSVNRLPSMNFQKETSPPGNINKPNEYLPPNQINQNGRPLKQSQGFLQLNRQQNGNVESENTKKSQSPSAFTDSPVFEAQPQQSYGVQVPRNQKASQKENKYQSEFQTNQNRASSQTSFGFKPQKSTIMPNTELTTPFEPKSYDHDETERPLASSANFASNQPSNPENNSDFQSRLQPSENFSQIQVPSFNSQTVPLSYRQNQILLPQGFSSNSDTQYSASTLKPNFMQQKLGPDDSYIYSHPAIGFRTPQSSFPSASSGQFNNLRQQSAFPPNPPMLLQSVPKSSHYKGQVGDQLSGRGVKAPLPPTLAPSQYQTTVNGVTQAAISQFPSPKPTQSSQYNSKRINQFQQVQAFRQQKEETDKRIEPVVSSQQYTGEIYEYTKPAQTLPPPDSTTASSAIPQDQGQLSLSQFKQTKDQKIQRPISQFGQAGPMFIAEQKFKHNFDKNTNTENTQSKINFGASDVNKPFGAQPENIFRPEDAHPQFGSQNRTQPVSSHTQTEHENYELEEETSNDGVIPEVAPQHVSGLKPTCCRKNAGINQSGVDLPGLRREESESENRNSHPSMPFLFPSKLGQLYFSKAQNKPSGFVGQAEMFSGPEQPPSFDEETGYHY